MFFTVLHPQSWLLLIYLELVVYSVTRLNPRSTSPKHGMPPINLYVVTLSLFALVQCHSYVVEARKIVQGVFFGAPGYPRAYGMTQTP